MKSWLFYCDDYSDWTLDLGDKADENRVKASMSGFMIVSGDLFGSATFRQTGAFSSEMLPLLIPTNRILLLYQSGPSPQEVRQPLKPIFIVAKRRYYTIM